VTGRQPRPIGTHGKVTTRQISPPGTPRGQLVFESTTRIRDADGHLRRVKRTGASKTAAENNLAEALRVRRLDADATLKGDTRMAVAGERWLDVVRGQVDAGDRAPRTLETYESAWRTHVLPAFGELRLREVTTSRCEAWMLELRKRVGPSMCKTARAVLSGILGYAARMDAIATNPVRDISEVPGSRTRQPRSMTRAERDAWLAWMDTHVADKPRPDGSVPRYQRPPERTADVAKSRALGDITRFMLATGCRIGEAMAVSWDEVDLDAGTVAICWHIVRVKGEGLKRMPGAKSEAGDRLLKLPRWCVDMLMARRVDQYSGYPVFPDGNGGWRDPNLIMRWIRWSRDEAGFSWVSSHVFRQTVLTVLDEAGLPQREIADQAGHSKIEHTQSYMQRQIRSGRAAEVLEDLL
jgi:integrase